MKTISFNSDACRVPGVGSKPNAGGRAFTIVELLVVISIIGILAALLLPVLAKAKLAAQKKQAVIEIAQIVAGIQKYDSDYGRFPVSKEDQDLVALNKTLDFTCGGTGYDASGNNPLWKMGLTNNAEVIAILMDATNYPGGGPTPNMNHAKNPQRTIFLSAKTVNDDKSPGLGSDGVYRDPWGGPYIITMDLSYDEQCRDSNYCTKVVSQLDPGKSPGQNGLFNPDANPDTDNYLYHGKVMVWSAGPDRKIELDAANVPNGKANDGYNRDNILSWQ
jgi:prepilin-type N-terminal cleavage/methylation domain-containing protein